MRSIATDVHSLTADPQHPTLAIVRSMGEHFFNGVGTFLKIRFDRSTVHVSRNPIGWMMTLSVTYCTSNFWTHSTKLLILF